MPAAILESALLDAANKAVEAKVTPETRDPEPLWGINWRVRSAAWILRHRSLLERALD